MKCLYFVLCVHLFLIYKNNLNPYKTLSIEISIYELFNNLGVLEKLQTGRHVCKENGIIN